MDNLREVRMTGIPDITDGVSLTELLRGVSRSTRERDDREDEFVRDPADIDDSIRTGSFDELNEEQAQLNRENSQQVSFVERARQASEADTVARLIEGLGRLETEPVNTEGAVRLPDRDLGAATFGREEDRGLGAAGDERTDDLVARQVRQEAEQERGATSDAIQRFGDARGAVLAERLNTQVGAIGERTTRFIEGSREVDAAFTARRNTNISDGFDVRDEAVARRGELNQALASNETDLLVAGRGRENEEQARLGALESSLRVLAEDQDQTFDAFVESRQVQRVATVTDVFGGSAIERAVSSREASTSLRLLDEQEALTVLQNQPNAVVVGSNVVEEVAEDGRVIETRLEEDDALRNPGNDIFFDREAQRDLGNILNGRS